MERPGVTSDFDPSALRLYRTLAGLSQAELARRARLLGAGVHKSTVCLYECGRRRPRPRTLMALASVLGVEPQALLIQREQQDLAALRLRAGLRQREVADHLGIAQARWSRVERGRSTLAAALLVPAAELFGVSVAQLGALVRISGHGT